MSGKELRQLLGASVTVRTATGAEVHGRLLSCTARSLWLVDDAEGDVVLPIETVVRIDRDAA